MPVIQFNPRWEIENAYREMNRFVRNNFGRQEKEEVNLREFQPRIDISENAKNLFLEIEIPGVNREDVKVSVNEENVLTIRGEKKFAGRENENMICCKNEREYGKFTRSFQLGDLVDTEKIDAKYEDGILFLAIPKLEPVKPKEQTIEIK